jgi:hypothetical protein
MPGVPLTYVSIGDSVLQRIGLQTRDRRGGGRNDIIVVTKQYDSLFGPLSLNINSKTQRRVDGSVVGSRLSLSGCCYTRHLTWIMRYMQTQIS